MAKILGKTHSPYVPDADTHSLTLTHTHTQSKSQGPNMDIFVSTRAGRRNLVLNCRTYFGVLIFTCKQFCNTHQCTVSIVMHSNHKFFNEGEK